MIVIAASFWVGLIWVVLAVVTLMLIGLILIQDSKAGGLSTAFGNVGGDSLLGARAQRDLAKFTVWLLVIFVVLAILGGVLDKRGTSIAGSDDPLNQTPSIGADPGTAPPSTAPPGGGTPATPGAGGTGSGATGSGMSAPPTGGTAPPAGGDAAKPAEKTPTETPPAETPAPKSGGGSS